MLTILLIVLATPPMDGDEILPIPVPAVVFKRLAAEVELWELCDKALLVQARFQRQEDLAEEDLAEEDLVEEDLVEVLLCRVDRWLPDEEARDRIIYNNRNNNNIIRIRCNSINTKTTILMPINEKNNE